MDRRLGGAVIVIDDPDKVELLNKIISNHSSIVLGRQGIPMREREQSVISLVIEGTTDEFGALAGQLGSIQGIRVKTVMVT